MPNWCSNDLVISGSEKDIASFKNKAVGKGWCESNTGENVLDFNQFVSMPQSVINNGYNGEGKRKGVSSGYDWESNNWGVKWGACEDSLYEVTPHTLSYCFETAWTPPLKMMEVWHTQYPELEFVLDYEELGMMFAGKCVADKESVYDESWDITEEMLHSRGFHDGDEEEYAEFCPDCALEAGLDTEHIIRKEIDDSYREEI